MNDAMRYDYLKIYDAAMKADAAWQAELVRLFGKKAGDVRYQPAGKGQEGSELRRLYLEFRRTSDALQAAWEAVWDEARAKRKAGAL
ncbi:MAG: hypothetical protein KGZ69_08745 [Methylomonas sp.]|nr:hypothetical protein [Methylomonas sp.]